MRITRDILGGIFIRVTSSKNKQPKGAIMKNEVTKKEEQSPPEEKKENFFTKTVEKANLLAQTAAKKYKESKEINAQKRELTSREARLKKYAPLFPEEYKASTFKLPNLIIIVDDAVRKGIDVCEGAIGWLSQQRDMEILHLYDEFVPHCGLNFFPTPTCDSIYYVHPLNRKTFLCLDDYFDIIQQEKLAELQHIAFSLGAKQYQVEMIEDRSKKEKTKININPISDNEAKLDHKNESTMRSESGAKAVFDSQREAVQPTLSWFAHDNNVLNLIKIRCVDKINPIHYTIEFKNSSNISQTTTAKISAAVKGMKLHCDFDKDIEVKCNKITRFIFEF